MELYSNEYFKLLEKDTTVFIHSFAGGFPLKDFQNILNELPRVTLTKFAALKAALETPKEEPIEIGTLKPEIEIVVAKDEMSAQAKINVPVEELVAKKGHIHSQLIEALRQAGVIEGYLESALQGPFVYNELFTVAEGRRPVNGENASVKYYEAKAVSPTMDEDGNVDFFEMNFVDDVKVGDWLGLYIPPTEGTPGSSVRGTVLPARKGKDRLLHYDPATVIEVQVAEGIELRAQARGEVKWSNGRIGIVDCLTINGDVGPETGNIKYLGSVKITGTVHDRYSVVATGDISIWGESGVGAVEQICSEEGNVYIKGGIFGDGQSLIKARKNVYSNCANDCVIEADNDIYIERYAIGSTLTASNVLLSKKHGRVIGGKIRAEYKVTSATTGNVNERPTMITVEGFNRNEVKQEFDQLLHDYKELLVELERVESEIDIYSTFTTKLSEGDHHKYSSLIDKRIELSLRVQEIEETRQRLIEVLKVRGEGEVGILSKAFPKTILQLKELEKHIDQTTAGFFYVNNRELHRE